MRLNSQQLTMQLTREHFGMRSSFKLCGFFTRIVYVAIVDLQKVQITVGTMSKAAVVSGQPSMFRGKFRSDSIQGETVSFDLTADRRLFDFDLRTSILTTTSNPHTPRSVQRLFWTSCLQGRRFSAVVWAGL